MGHASIAETEGTYGHLVREHHERDVDALEAALGSALTSQDADETRESLDSRRPAASHCVPPATGRPLSADRSAGESMVEGKGFVGTRALSPRYFERGPRQNAAESGSPRNQAQPVLLGPWAAGRTSSRVLGAQGGIHRGGIHRNARDRAADGQPRHSQRRFPGMGALLPSTESRLLACPCTSPSSSGVPAR